MLWEFWEKLTQGRVLVISWELLLVWQIQNNTILILKTDSRGRSAVSCSVLAKRRSYIERGVSHTNVSPAWFHPRCVSMTGNCLTIEQTGHAVLNWSSRWREITCNMQSGCGCCHTARKWQWWKLCRPTVPYHSAFWTCSVTVTHLQKEQTVCRYCAIQKAKLNY